MICGPSPPPSITRHLDTDSGRAHPASETHLGLASPRPFYDVGGEQFMMLSARRHRRLTNYGRGWRCSPRSVLTGQIRVNSERRASRLDGPGRHSGRPNPAMLPARFATSSPLPTPERGGLPRDTLRPILGAPIQGPLLGTE